MTSWGCPSLFVYVQSHHFTCSKAGTQVAEVLASTSWDSPSSGGRPLDGLCTTMALLPEAAVAATAGTSATSASSCSVPEAVACLLDRLSGRLQPGSNATVDAGGAVSASGGPGTGVLVNGGSPLSWVSRRLLSANREALLGDEKTQLGNVLAFLKQVGRGAGFEVQTGVFRAELVRAGGQPRGTACGCEDAVGERAGFPGAGGRGSGVGVWTGMF